MQREAPSEKKLFFFKLTLTLGFSLLWPFLIWGALKENKHYEVQPVSDDFEHKGLKFQYMGGHGKLSCNDCDFQQSQTSFIHGIDCNTTGYQCQECGKLTSIVKHHSKAANHASRQCGCGGKLNREKILFCPDCNSQNLSYSMEYIT